MASVEEIPIAREQASFALHAGVESGARIRRLNMKSRGRNAVLDGPIHGAMEDVFSVIIHTENEAAIDHDAERVQAIGDRFVVAAEVLALVAAFQVFRRERLEAYEDATQTGFCGTFDEIPAQD